MAEKTKLRPPTVPVSTPGLATPDGFNKAITSMKPVAAASHPPRNGGKGLAGAVRHIPKN